MHLNIEFADGSHYGAQIRQSLRAGESTRDIIFPGEARALRDVEMVFRNRNHRVTGQTTFQLYGRRASPEPETSPDPRSEPSRGWVEMSPAASAAGIGSHVRPASARLGHSVTTPRSGAREARVQPQPGRPSTGRPLRVDAGVVQ